MLTYIDLYKDQALGLPKVHPEEQIWVVVKIIGSLI